MLLQVMLLVPVIIFLHRPDVLIACFAVSQQLKPSDGHIHGGAEFLLFTAENVRAEKLLIGLPDLPEVAVGVHL